LKEKSKRRLCPAGGILAYSELLHRLQQGEIFSPDSWRVQQLRGAAYEVRLASDLMFVRGRGGESIKFGPGEHHSDPIILNEGEVALVSSAEKCRFPSDLAAFISTKWDLSRRGLLVLTGGFVNPRFGLKNVDGQWVPKEDERLHFLLVNLGSEPQSLTPEETRLASVQFSLMVGDPGSEVAQSTQSIITDDYSPDAPVTALAVFRELRRQRRRLDRLTSSFDKLEHGFQPLLTFGIYLLAITFLGVVLSNGLQLASQEHVRQMATLFGGHWQFTAIVIAAIIGITVIGKRVLDLMVALVSTSGNTSRKRNRRQSR